MCKPSEFHQVLSLSAPQNNPVREAKPSPGRGLWGSKWSEPCLGFCLRRRWREARWGLLTALPALPQRHPPPPPRPPAGESRGSRRRVWAQSRPGPGRPTPSLSQEGPPDSEHETDTLVGFFLFSSSCLTRARSCCSRQMLGLEFLPGKLADPRGPKPVGAVPASRLQLDPRRGDGRCSCDVSAAPGPTEPSDTVGRWCAVLIPPQQYLPFLFHAWRERCLNFTGSYLCSTA